MKFPLTGRYTFVELMSWTRENSPTTIIMNTQQSDWYTVLVRQRVFNCPLKFMGIDIKVVE